MKKRVAIGFLGTVLDQGGARRWHRWRPTVSLCEQPGMPIDRLELLYTPGYESLANRVKNDLAGVSPLTEVRLTSIVTHGVSRRNR